MISARVALHSYNMVWVTAPAAHMAVRNGQTRQYINKACTLARERIPTPAGTDALVMEVSSDSDSDSDAAELNEIAYVPWDGTCAGHCGATITEDRVCQQCMDSGYAASQGWRMPKVGEMLGGGSGRGCIDGRVTSVSVSETGTHVTYTPRVQPWASVSVRWL